MSIIPKSTLSAMDLGFNTSDDSVPRPNETATGAACLSASSSWWEGSRSFRRLHLDCNSSIVKTTTGYHVSASTYKYCDGVPRVSGTEGITVLTTFTLPPAQWFTTFEVYPGTTVEYPVPPPRCSVDALDCKSAIESFDSNVSRWPSNDDFDIDIEWFRPSCSTTPGCFLVAGEAHLIYWPSTLVQSSTYSCDNGTILKETVAPTDTGLVTAVSNGTTYTSPTLYVSFDSVWNECDPPDCSSGTYNTRYNVVIAMDSRSLSSARPTTKVGETNSFNFLDLTGPLPLAVYQNQLRCHPFGHDIPICETIFDDYYPELFGPQELKNADPAFASCVVNFFGMKDPPIALQRQDGLINTETITPVGEPTAEPASPGKSSQLDQAPKTVGPTAQGDPPVQASSQASLQPADLSRTFGSPTSISKESDPSPSSVFGVGAQQDPSGSWSSSLQGLLSSAVSQQGSLDGGANQEGAGESQHSAERQQGEQSNGNSGHNLNTIISLIRSQFAPPLYLSKPAHLLAAGAVRVLQNLILPSPPQTHTVLLRLLTLNSSHSSDQKARS